ncbi:MAG: alpha/beta fold hydrolase [Gammaproteobacteria bacterium]
MMTISILMLALLHPAQASDLAKEQRWADQIVDDLIDGEAEWLDLGKHKALAIYTESATDDNKGGVIVIHGSGAHPNWAEVVQPLRTQLPEHGWATLSLQMPVLANDADYTEYAPLFDEVAPRINAAIKNLQAKGINNISIVAHSLGSAMSAYYLANHKSSAIKSFVAVGMPGPRQDKRMDTVLALQQINIPVLDLYGQNDLDYILETSGQRKQAGSHNKNYSQQVVAGANHFFVNKNDVLIRTVNQWLSKY